jgi:hypothetical protein
MPFRPIFRSLALPILGGVLVLGLACKGKSNSSDPVVETTAIVSGTISFERKVVTRDVNGVPTGIEATPSQTNLPVRGGVLALYRQVDVTENNVTKTYFVRESTSLTGLDGTYSVTVMKGERYMLELQSSIQIRATTGLQTVNVLADDPVRGMYSQTPVINRYRYCIRRALDGTPAATGAGQNHVAVSAVQGNTTLNMHIGVNDSWFLADTEPNQLGSLPVNFIVPSYSPGSAGYQQAGALESAPSGSKINAILDSFANFAYCQGTTYTALPVTADRFLDLHYTQGTSQPKGTFVEYDRASYPKVANPTQDNVAFDPFMNSLHYLGCIRGTGTDDAWDDGLLMSLAARGYYYATMSPRWPFTSASLYGQQGPLPVAAPLTHLQSEMALMEGLSQAFAAVIQKNPYLGLAGTNISDVSSLTDADKTIYSAPLIRALGWKLALRAQSINTYPGTPADWPNLNIQNMLSFFLVSIPGDYTDSPNLYLQLSALSAATSSVGGLNPSTVFTEANLQGILSSAPFNIPVNNIPYPRPTGGALGPLVADWGTHPSGILPSVQLSMSKAVVVGSTYPNLTPEELQYARFIQFGNKRYTFSVTTTPASLSGGQIEVTFISPSTPTGLGAQTFLLSGTSAPTTITLNGPVSADGFQLVRLRMISPSTPQPDTTVTVTLTPQN